MYHYHVRVPAWEESQRINRAISDRLDRFNYRNKGHYLMFDNGNDDEMRFILVSEIEITETILTSVKDIFRTEVLTEEIDVNNADPKTARKIDAAIASISNNVTCGCHITLFPAWTLEFALEKANEIPGSGQYKAYCAGFPDYAERTAGTGKKAIYNVVLINNMGGLAADFHLTALHLLYAATGVITDPTVIVGDVNEAQDTEKDTGLFYIICDYWETDGREEFFKGLCDKIKQSNNIYITAMSQEKYDMISLIDGFADAFPNVITIDKFTKRERRELIRLDDALTVRLDNDEIM